MARKLPWVTSGSTNTPKKKAPDTTKAVGAATSSSDAKAKKRPRILLDSDSEDDSDDLDASTVKSKRKRRDRVSSSSPSPAPAKDGNRTPSSSPPPTLPPPKIEYMTSSDERYKMVEDELTTMAHAFTRDIHQKNYEELQKLAAQKSRKTLEAMTRPTDNKSVLGKASEMRKIAEKKRERMVKVGATHPGQNEEPPSDDEENVEMIITDRHLAGLMHAQRGSMPGKRVLEDLQPTKLKTRAAAGFAKQDNGSPKRGKGGRFALPDLDDIDDFVMPRSLELSKVAEKPRREEPKKKKKPIPQDETTDNEDLDAPVLKKAPAKPLSKHTATTKSISIGLSKPPMPSSLSMLPPLREKPPNLHREASSISSQSQSQKTYPRPSLKREPSSAGSPAKKLTFEDVSPFASKRASISASQATTVSSASQVSTKSVKTVKVAKAVQPPSPPPVTSSQFTFDDIPIRRSAAIVPRKRGGVGGGSKRKQEPSIKIEEIPIF